MAAAGPAGGNDLKPVYLSVLLFFCFLAGIDKIILFLGRGYCEPERRLFAGQIFNFFAKSSTGAAFFSKAAPVTHCSRAAGVCFGGQS